MSDLTESMLAKPTEPQGRPSKAKLLAPDRAIEVSGTAVEAEIRGPLGTVDQGTALAYLTEEGLDPAEWEATHFRKIRYGKDMESVKFSYRRRGMTAGLDIDDLVKLVTKRGGSRARKERRKDGPEGYVVALGDMQFGKIDGDGVEGAVRRSVEYLNAARDRLYQLRKQHEIGHVHIAFLGDHIEGFTSQGGANSWRTPLTLNEQIRLTRRVMFHAVQIFAQTSSRVSLIAVPGNHGRVVSANGSQTRYDDSHDTEALIAVSEACAVAPSVFGHVEFYVPATDEITVVLDVAGTRLAHVHGDRWTKGKHFEWWEGQAFSNPRLAEADVLFGGHYHFSLFEENGRRMYVQVPALEAESTWYRHKKGVMGNPGVFTALVGDGRLHSMELVRD